MPDPVTLVTVPQYELQLFQFAGTDKVFKITVRNLDGVTATNITGWAISFVVHAYGDPNNVFFTLTVGSGVTISNGPAGEMTVTVAATNITNMVPDLFGLRLERTDSGNDFVIGRGTWSLMQR